LLGNYGNMLKSYKGSYVKGKREGEGTYKFKNRARYVGYYKQNMKHGSGTFYYPDGSVYEGEWFEDKKSGKGTYTYPNKDVYVGDWKDDKRHGNGTYTYNESGSIYVGMWDQGNAHGPGELKHKNFRYQGGWSESMTQGAGKFIFDIGCESHGEYIPVEKATDNEEEENVEPALEPKWKFDRITSITIDEPIAT